jgi:hypothetical protein
MTKIFHINIKVNKTMINVMFDFGSKDNIIARNLIKIFGLEVHGHHIPYPLGWVNKDKEINVMKHCNIKFSISANFIDEVELDIVPIDVCGVVFGSPYMYMRDEIFMQRAKQYRLIKDGKS